MSYYSPNRSFFHGPDNISHVISCSRQPTQRSKFQHRFVNLPGRIGKWARTIWKYQPYPTHILIRFLCNHEFTKEKKQHKSWSGEYTDAILTRLSAEISTSDLQCGWSGLTAFLTTILAYSFAKLDFLIRNTINKINSLLHDSICFLASFAAGLALLKE